MEVENRIFPSIGVERLRFCLSVRTVANRIVPLWDNVRGDVGFALVKVSRGIIWLQVLSRKAE